MEVSFIKLCSFKIPRAYLIKKLKLSYLYLKKRKIRDLKKTHLSLVFVSSLEIKKINKKYRKKDKVTDVLSFEDDSLGELILCPEYIKKQAKKSDMPFQDFLLYYILHGLLHLLGFTHEKNPKKAEKMFKLQDDLFEYVLKR